MNDFTWHEVGTRVRQMRLARSLSQQALAEKAGLTQNAVFRIEGGETNPQLSSLRQISSALGCSVREIVIGTASNDPILARHLRRVKRVLESGDEAAIRVMDNGIETAEALLERSGVRREVPPLKRILKGGGRHSQADELRLMHGPVRKRSEVDAVSGSATVQKAFKPLGGSRTSHGRINKNE